MKYFVFLLLFFCSNVVYAETIKSGCASGCDYTSCTDWTTYLVSQSPLSDDETLDVRDLVTDRCNFSSINLNGHTIKLSGNASCRDANGVAEAADCTISTDHSAAVVYVNTDGGNYLIDGLVLKQTGDRSADNHAGIWISGDNTVTTVQKSMIVFAGTGAAGFTNGAVVLDTTADVVLANIGISGWDRGISADLREADSIKAYAVTIRNNGAYGILINCWRGANEVLDLRNILITTATTAALSIVDTCTNQTVSKVFCTDADTDCSDYSKTITFDDSGNDFRQASGSNGVDAGNDLSGATPAITTDMRGISRTGTYDVGSYEITGDAAIVKYIPGMSGNFSEMSGGF